MIDAIPIRQIAQRKPFGPSHLNDVVINSGFNIAPAFIMRKKDMIDLPEGPSIIMLVNTPVTLTPMYVAGSEIVVGNWLATLIPNNPVPIIMTTKLFLNMSINTTATKPPAISIINMVRGLHKLAIGIEANRPIVSASQNSELIYFQVLTLMLNQTYQTSSCIIC
jgi:hypothetical protein